MEALGCSSLPVLGHSDMSPCTVDVNAAPVGTVTVTVAAVAASPIDAISTTGRMISDVAT
jgi:hypothetical protein